MLGAREEIWQVGWYLNIKSLRTTIEWSLLPSLNDVRSGTPTDRFLAGAMHWRRVESMRRVNTRVDSPKMHSAVESKPWP